MVHILKLITSLSKADRILTHANFTGNFSIFAQVQPKRLELKQFFFQLSSHPQKGFDKPFSQWNGNKSCAYTTGVIRADRKLSSLSGRTDGREGDEKNSKGGPGSGGTSNKKKVLFGIGTAGVLGVCWVYLNQDGFKWKGAVFTFFILCAHWGLPLPTQIVREIVPGLNVLLHHKDADVLFVSVWTLKLLTDGGKKRIQMVIDSGVLPKLVQLLNSGEVKVQQATLRAVCNILKGADGQMQAVLNRNALSHFHNLLNHPENCTWAVWVLGMLIFKKFTTVQAIRDAGLIPLIVHHLEEGELQTQKAAALGLSALTISGSKEQVAHLINCGAIPALCNILNWTDSQVLHAVLVGIYNILAKLSVNQDGGDKVCTLMKECGGWDKIEQLQNHENLGICKVAHDIILKFSSDDVKEKAYLMPNAAEMLKP